MRLAELTKTGKTLTRANVVDADVRSATLVLVAVGSGRLNGVTPAVGAERTVDALGGPGASVAVGNGRVGNALLVHTVTRRATRVLVANVTERLDVLARTTVAVRTGHALFVVGAVRVVGTSADPRNTPELVTQARGTVGVGVAAVTRGGGGSGGRRSGRRDGGGNITTGVVVKGGGDVLKDLTVNEVTRNGLNHLHNRKKGGGNEESGAE